MIKVIKKFLVLLIPTCSIGAVGLWLALRQTGIWCIIGWIIGVLSGIYAALLMLIVIHAFIRIKLWEIRGIRNLEEIQKRDAELFAQGKSFDEVMSQYKKPKD